MYISRQLPVSIEDNNTAISIAKERKDNPPAYGNILSDATSLLVDNIVVLLKAARADIFGKKAASTQATADKDVSHAFQHMLNSHYIQVLNFHIDEKIFPASYRSFYGIPVTSKTIPVQTTETEVAALSQTIIDGEALMIAAGGHAIPFPLVATIHTHLLALLLNNKKHLDATDALNNALENNKELSKNASAVSKKVWDEVETYFDGGTIESTRKNSRNWGVYYASTGVPVEISAHVVEMVAGVAVPIVGANVLVAETEATAVSGAEGAILVKVLITGTVTLQFTMTGFTEKIVSTEINSSANIDLGIVVMVRGV